MPKPATIPTTSTAAQAIMTVRRPTRGRRRRDINGAVLEFCRELGAACGWNARGDAHVTRQPRQFKDKLSPRQVVALVPYAE